MLGKYFLVYETLSTSTSLLFSLSFRHQYALAKGYCRYWLHAMNEHSLHAPFVYHLYCQAIKPDKKESHFVRLENIRASLRQSTERISVDDLGAGSRVESSADRAVRSIAKHGLSSPKFSRLLNRLITYFDATYVVELGTALGVNTLYLSTACPTAKIYSLEGAEALADHAESLFAQEKQRNIKVVRGDIDQTLPQLLADLPRVDLAYLDANHRYAPTVHNFEQIVSKVHQKSVVVIDDIYWSAGMQRAWQHIQEHEAVTVSVDLFDAGLVFFTPQRVKQHYTLMF